MKPLCSPIIVHHMAALDSCAYLPNSLEAIRASLGAGAACIEIDVTALADEDFLLVHDPDLASETTGSGPVGQYTASQARILHFKEAAGLICVPLLSDVVSAFYASPGGTRLQIDFKDMIPFPDDEPLRRLVKLIEPLGNRVIVSTSADWQLRKLHALAPWLDLGLDIHFYLDWYPAGEAPDPRAYPRTKSAYGYWDDHPIASQRFWPTAEYLADRCQALIGLVPGVSTFYVSHRFLCQSLADGLNWADLLHDRNIRLDAWTLDVGTPEAESIARRLLTSGVDMFTSNTPLALRALLKPDSREL